MSDERAIGVVWLLGALILVGSALVVRRRERGWLPAAIVWLIIFAVLFLIAHAIDGGR